MKKKKDLNKLDKNNSVGVALGISQSNEPIKLEDEIFQNGNGHKFEISFTLPKSTSTFTHQPHKIFEEPMEIELPSPMNNFLNSPLNQVIVPQPKKEINIWAKVPSLNFEFSKRIHIDLSPTGFQVDDNTSVYLVEVGVYFLYDKKFTEIEEKILKNLRTVTNGRFVYKSYPLKDQLAAVFNRPWKIDNFIIFRLSIANKTSTLKIKPSSKLELTINNKINPECIDQLESLLQRRVKLEEDLKDYYDILDIDKLKLINQALPHVENLISSFKLESSKVIPNTGIHYHLDKVSHNDEKEFMNIRFLICFEELADLLVSYKGKNLFIPQPAAASASTH